MFWHASHEARRRVPGSSDDLLVDGAEGASMLAAAVVKRARCGIEIDKSNSSLKEWDCVWSGVVWVWVWGLGACRDLDGWEEVAVAGPVPVLWV